MSLALFATLALAEMPLPSWREVLIVEEWYKINHFIEEERYAPALARAEAVRASIAEDPRILYLVGLAHRSAGRPREAEAAWERAVSLDPTREDAWYDLGELAFGEGRYAEADGYYAQVEAQVTEGPLAAVAPRRRAECAGLRGDAAGFETHLRTALRRGFSLREIMGDPTWSALAADPALQSSVEKMVTVYGDSSVLRTLTPPDPER